jgi:DNA-binding CsgD family transcriptional regulator/tetratricopeptide (TPR) repeat protein
VVFEDVHWADEATLDLLRVLGRRLRAIPALVIATYRDDEVGAAHPLRRALGDIPAAMKSEVAVPPLSLAAVAEMTKSSRLDPSAVLRSTRGNPFFVTEVVAEPTVDVPRSVNDLVLARVSRLSPSAQQVVRAASALGQRSEIAVLLQLGGSAAGADEGIASGILEVEGDAVQFRHELARRAVYEALGIEERTHHHREALRVLRARSSDPGTLAWHAVEARDDGAALAFSQAAGDRAKRFGAHAEAAAHYATALRFADELDDRERSGLLERYAREAMLVDDVDGAVGALRSALELRRRTGDVRGEGECLRALSEVLWFAGATEEALGAAQRAVDLLEATSPHGVELARAYASLAQRLLLAGHDDEMALDYAKRALQLADRVCEEQVAVHALTTIGVLYGYLDGSGLVELESALTRALAAGLDADAARALINIVELARDTRRYDLADRYEEEALGFLSARDHDLDLLRRRLLSDLADLALDRGRWDRAGDLASALVEEGSSGVPVRMRALTVIGRLRARRGEADPWTPLDDALDLAIQHGEAQEVCPVLYARAEAAWLDGDLERAGREAARGLDAARRVPTPWWLGEGAFWLWKSGVDDALPEGAAEPYVLQINGRSTEAATAWRAIGCPYEEAFALADSPAETDLRAALGLFRELGAEPMARRVAARLRELGASRISRGPRAVTRANPGGLTDRELEVLRHLTHGLSNADIAAALVLSPKTVDHHVSSILRKLRVANRAAAAERAESLGVKDGESEGGR